MPVPFEKGNNYWSFRNKHGRGFSYTPELLWDEAVKYFEWISTKVWNKKEAIKSGDLAGTLIDIPTNTPMSIESFCLYADIDRDTFKNYESNEGSYKDFFGVTKAIRTIIESQQFEGATVGAYNPNIIARKLGLVDKTGVDHTTKGESIKEDIDYSKLSDDVLKAILDAKK
jgi:hypothetical protein